MLLLQISESVMQQPQLHNSKTLPNKSTWIATTPSRPLGKKRFDWSETTAEPVVVRMLPTAFLLEMELELQSSLCNPAGAQSS